MVVPYSPTAIANNFLEQYAEPDSGIEHMKLQKLVYCAYGWWLAANGIDAVRLTSEGPEIWKHGPVFSGLYRTFRVFGREPITEMVSANPLRAPVNVDDDDDDVRSLVRWTWRRYGHLSSFALSDMTHRPGSPWHRTATDHEFRVQMNLEIPDQYIFEEFSRLLDADQARPPQDSDAGANVNQVQP